MLVTVVLGERESGIQLWFGITVLLVPLLLHIHVKPHLQAPTARSLICQLAYPPDRYWVLLEHC